MLRHKTDKSLFSILFFRRVDQTATAATAKDQVECKYMRTTLIGETSFIPFWRSLTQKPIYFDSSNFQYKIVFQTNTSLQPVQEFRFFCLNCKMRRKKILALDRWTWSEMKLNMSISFFYLFDEANECRHYWNVYSASFIIIIRKLLVSFQVKEQTKWCEPNVSIDFSFLSVSCWCLCLFQM